MVHHLKKGLKIGKTDNSQNKKDITHANNIAMLFARNSNLEQRTVNYDIHSLMDSIKGRNVFFDIDMTVYARERTNGKTYEGQHVLTTAAGNDVTAVQEVYALLEGGIYTSPTIETVLDHNTEWVQEVIQAVVPEGQASSYKVNNNIGGNLGYIESFEMPVRQNKYIDFGGPGFAGTMSVADSTPFLFRVPTFNHEFSYTDTMFGLFLDSIVPHINQAVREYINRPLINWVFPYSPFPPYKSDITIKGKGTLNLDIIKA